MKSTEIDDKIYGYDSLVITELAHDGRTLLLSRFAQYPLRILFIERKVSVNPDGLLQTSKTLNRNCMWIYPINFGGGIVSGDDLTSFVHIKQGSRCVITTQASTKVYQALPGCSSVDSAQKCHYRVEDGAVLCVFPEPVSCFYSARYKQETEYTLSERACLIHVDWLTCGRQNRERWDMEYYNNLTRIYRSGKPILYESVSLVNSSKNIHVSERMGEFNVLGLVVVIGDELTRNKKFAEAVETSFTNSSEVIISPGILQDEAGLAYKFVATSTEEARRILYQAFKPLEKELGETPFA